MTFFIDLIAQSYRYHIKDKEAEIAQFFFEAQNQSEYLKGYFYVELISEIESLIEKTYSKVSKNNINLKGSKQDIIDEIARENIENHKIVKEDSVQLVAIGGSCYSWSTGENSRTLCLTISYN